MMHIINSTRTHEDTPAQDRGIDEVTRCNPYIHHLSQEFEKAPLVGFKDLNSILRIVVGQK